MSDDVPDRAELLDRVADTTALTSLEQCLLVWELVTAVGVPDYPAYAAWQEGRCAKIDAAGKSAAYVKRSRRSTEAFIFRGNAR